MMNRPNVTSTVWGLLFIAVATVALLGTGGMGLSLATLSSIAAVVLIGLGALTLLLTRQN